MENIEYTPQQVTNLRELERRSQDEIRVYNYTSEDFQVSWDRYLWTIPNKDRDTGSGKGQAILPRYVAENYVKHFTDKVLSIVKDKAIADEQERRKEKGQELLKVDSEDRLRYETQFRIDNPEKRRDIIKKIWLGIEREYGVDQIPDMAQPNLDDRSLDQKLLAELEKPAQKREEETEQPLDAKDAVLKSIEEKKARMTKELEQ